MTPASVRNREWRKANPMKYAFMTLRDNSKRRGKIFTLTYEQFAEFCYETNYIKRKGIHSKNYSIDCKEAHLGYTIDNICCMRMIDNQRKATKAVVFEMDAESRFKVKKYRFL